MPTTDTRPNVFKAKTSPADLRCDRPYPLSHGGRLTFARAADAKLVEHYALAWKESVRRLVALFREMLSDVTERRLLYHLVSPKEIPTWLLADPLFADLNTATGLPASEGLTEPEKDRRWMDFSTGSSHALLRAVVKPDVKDRVGAPFRESLARHGVKSRLLTAERFEQIFELLPADMERAGIANAVCGIFKSFLSQAENGRRQNLEKQELRRNLQDRHGAFFTEFDRYSRHVNAWGHCCLVWIEARKKLIDDRLDRELINACQMVVARRHLEVPGWGDLIFSDAGAALAETRPDLVEAFEQALPTITPPPRDQPSFLYRRFGRKADLRKLAYDVWHLSRVLIIYRDNEGLFADEAEVDRLIHCIDARRPAIHQGWLEICNDKKTPGFKVLKDFFRGPVRDWIASSRPNEEAILNDNVGSWPLFREGRDWELIEPPGDFRGIDGLNKRRGNELILSLKVPRFVSPADPAVRLEAKVSLTLSICGSLHRLAGAKTLESQIDVRNGLMQFRPGRALQSSRHGQPFVTYVKEQALRIMVRNSKIIASIAVTEMTETAADPTVIKQFRKNVQPGERVALLHYLPGGDRLASLMIFTKAPDALIGWREVPFIEEVHRTDGDRGDRNLAHKPRIVLNLQDASIAYHLSIHEGRRMSIARQAGPEANAESIVEFGPARTQMGRTHYKQVAAQITKILRQSGVSYCLLAVAGHGLTIRGNRNPVANFFAMSQATGPSGSLVVALQKSGIRLLVASGSYGSVDVRRAITTGSVDDLDWGVAYHMVSKKGTATAARYGRRDFLLCRKTNDSREYPRNACWASLLAAFSPEMAKAMDRLMENLDGTPGAVENRWAAFATPKAA